MDGEEPMKGSSLQEGYKGTRVQYPSTKNRGFYTLQQRTGGSTKDQGFNTSHTIKH